MLAPGSTRTTRATRTTRTTHQAAYTAVIACATGASTDAASHASFTTSAICVCDLRASSSCRAVAV